MKHLFITNTFLLISLTIFTSTSVHCKKIVEFTNENVDEYVDGSKFVFIFFYAPWDDHCQRILQIFDQVADEFADRDDIVVGKSNAYEDVKIATRYWIDRYPMFRYFIKGSTTEETYDGGFKPDDFIRFIAARSYLKLNKAMFDLPLIELEKSNFERVVKNRAKDVLVFYYNGNCKLCDQMAYPYYHVGQAFRNEPDCVVARLNCDTNDGVCLQQKIPRFPTLKVYSKKNKDGWTYEPGKNNEMYSQQNLTTFMNSLCKTERLESGRLNTRAGRLDEFDKLAEEFVSDWHRREQILRTVREKTATHPSKKYAAYYAIVMTRIINEGSHMVQMEIERLERLIAGHVHASKSDELERKKNILHHFRALHRARDEL
ncbi:predicted protein [Nematostella vectensis]|uniref:protein disulfide-isomerase n=2 Tax=Nematostella vectensis TaxID=45351 RepID=A7RYL9_NEMVE|nr:predicted protein [Nematostella vectensis]|eukprot:XP_001635607.1 predicted protein [Nematostella vectensis]